MQGGFTSTIPDTPVTPASVSMPSMAPPNPRVKLPKNASRILHVKGLPFKISSEDLYDIFGKYGSIRQIRLGVAPETRGTCYVVYDDVYDAKLAVDHLNGFNVAGMYIALNYFDPAKQAQREERRLKEEENRIIREKSGFI